MNAVLNQLRRIFIDDGRNDRDFSDQEKRLNEAVKHLHEGAQSLLRASDILTYLLRKRNEVN